MITPDSLSPAAWRLYEQVQHLEVDGASANWPWATVCAAMAAPYDLLYQIVMGAETPFAIAFDPALAAEVLTPEQATKLLPWTGQFVGVQRLEDLPAIGQRIKLLETRDAKAGSPDSIIGAARARAIGPDGTPETATVLLLERIGGDPYHFAVTMYASEVPDPDATRRDIEAETPAGRFGTDPGTLFDFFLITGGDYETLLATHATYADAFADFATYQALIEDPAHT